MKKSIKKIIRASLKKMKKHQDHLKKFKFSNYQEDFVITEQEEREGGYFGSLNFRATSA